MSSTNRGKARKPGDTYYTDDRVARALVSTLPVNPGWTWVEPSCGGGAFIRAIRAHHAPGAVRIIGVDTDVDAAGLQQSDVWVNDDWLTCELGEAADCIVGNPPFDCAEAHVRRALDLVSDGGFVAFLLRLAFLESSERIAFWREHPPEVVTVLQERPSFTGGKTDSCAYAFMVWRSPDAPRLEPTRLEWLSWKTAGKRQPALVGGRER